MTEEERVQRDAYLRYAMTWANAAPKPSLEKRLDWLEADASAQRTAILRLERAAELICKSLWALLAINMLLALAGNPIVVDALVKRAESALEGKKE